MRKNAVINNLNPCPFCGSTKIKYSLKTVTSNWERYYHAVCYCDDCHTYGPRVLSEKEISRHQVEKDADLRLKAEEAWNKRCY